MIVLVGESASGKSTIERNLSTMGLNRVISYTTRPKRENETDGVDYHYITKDEFRSKLKEGFFAEHTSYRDWYYGSAVEDCTDDNVIVANPHGLRQLNKMPNINVISFYVKAPERVRLIRMLNRSDDILECFRRIFSDQGVFQNIEEETTYTLDGCSSIDELCKEIVNLSSKEMTNAINL